MMLKLNVLKLQAWEANWVISDLYIEWRL